MDYEKAYNEALEKAKKELLTCGSTDCAAYRQIIRFFPELQENEDERIRKELIKIFKGETRYTSQEDAEKYITWLEKQGEQKPFDYENANVQQKDFAPKFEPRFKVGDWIAHNTTNTTFCVNDISDGRYYITRSNGDKTYNSIKMVEDHAHLWTIKDAKPGDVLADVYGNIGIYEKCDDFDWMSYCSLGHNGGFQHFKIEHENEKTYPATKEQQKLLFEKMTEAGYKWDAEKKVLNEIKIQDLVTSKDTVAKISNQDKWDGEDIRMLNTVINIFEKVYPSNYFTTFVTGSENPTLINSPEIVKWLKGIKQKALGKLKLTKEDIEALRIAIINLGNMAEVDAINNFNMTFGEAKEKLIEIKDRYSE